jgi:hypothetical protein
MFVKSALLLLWAFWMVALMIIMVGMTYGGIKELLK